MTSPTDPLENLGRRSALAVAEHRNALDHEADVAAINRRAGRPRRRRITVAAVALLIALPLTVSRLQTPAPDVRFGPASAPAQWVEVGRDVFNGTEPPPETRPIEGTFAGGVSGVAVAGGTIVAVGFEPDQGPGDPARPMSWTSEDGRAWDPGGVDDGGSAYADADLFIEDVVAVVTGEMEWLIAVGYASLQPRTEPVMWESYDGGATWDLVPVGGTGAMTSVVVTPSGLVAVGFDNDRPAAWTSFTGEAWQPAEVAGPIGEAPGGLFDVAASGDRLVAVGADRTADSALWVSDGGASWEPATLPDVPDEALLELGSVSATGDGKFLAAGGLTTGGSETHEGIVLASADGAEWERQVPPLGTLDLDGQEQLSAIVPTADGLLAIGSHERSGTIWSSTGAGWESLFTDETVPAGGFSHIDELFATPAGLLATGIAAAEQGPQEARMWLRPSRDGEGTAPAPVEIIDQPIGTFGGGAPVGPVEVEGLRITTTGYGSGNVRAVDAATGVERWTTEIGDTAFLGPISGTTLLAAPQKGSVVALHTSTGRRRWVLPLDRSEGAGHPSVIDETVYVPTSFTGEGDTTAPRLYAVELKSGDVLWQTRLEEGTDLQWAPPIVAGNLVLVSDTPSHPRSAPSSWLHALDRLTGERVWRFDLETRTQGFNERPPLVADGRVFIAAPNAPQMFAIDLASGAELWRRPVPTYMRSMAMTEQGLDVRFENGRQTLDPATGTPID